MIILAVLLGIAIITIIAQWYAMYNSVRKLEQYEEAVQNYYESTSVVLHTMRAIDDRQLFEKDDDVGITFQMLVDTLNQLRPIIYGEPDGKEE